MNHLYNIIDFGIDYALGCSKEKNVMPQNPKTPKMNLENLITTLFMRCSIKQNTRRFCAYIVG